MVNQPESKAVEHSCRIYRWLLLVYPESHRHEYGVAILQLFRDQCRDAWAAQRMRGLIGFWLRAMADLLKTSMLEHLSNLNRSRIMPTLFRPTIKPLPAFFGICAVVFLPIFLASVLITFLLPETYGGEASIRIDPPASAKAVRDADWSQPELRAIFSSAVLERTVKKLDLENVWGKKYNNGGPLNVSDAVSLLHARLELFGLPMRGVSGRPDSVLIQVRAFSDNPEEAAAVANGVVESYRDFREAENRQATVVPGERQVTIMDRAVPIHRVVRPNKQLNIAIGALTGILIGVITAPLILGFVAWIRNRRIAPGVSQKA